jgi:hypothetical protein
MLSGPISSVSQTVVCTAQHCSERREQANRATAEEAAEKYTDRLVLQLLGPL